MTIVSTDWLNKNLDQVKILDCSWHLPSVNRDSFREYEDKHIPSAIFFDLDKNSDTDTDLPHMLPKKKIWENNISNLGINNDDKIVIYDNSDILSSCRCWYNFIYFGHNPKLVSILDGGFQKWWNERRVTSNKIENNIKTNYIAIERKDLVKNKIQIDKNIDTKEFIVVDARSKARFDGLIPEPRKNVRRGSIKNSICLPFNELINKDKTFKDKKQLLQKFEQALGNNIEKKIIFSCGSGVTAAVLALAYSLINNKYNPSIYDGSWAEYGKF